MEAHGRFSPLALDFIKQLTNHMTPEQATKQYYHTIQALATTMQRTNAMIIQRYKTQHALTT